MSKELASILSKLTGLSEHHVKYSEEFVESVTSIKIEETEILVSFYVISLFTKVPVDLAIKVAQERLHKLQNLNELTKRSVKDICNSLQICLEATYLTFRKKNFKQIFGTAMGSPVSVVVANLVMENVETRAIETFAHPPRLWQRYVDDTFVIIEKKFLNIFFDNINNLEPSIKLTMETENDNQFPFLDTFIQRSKNGEMSSSIFRKPTQIDHYLNFRSDHPLQHKRAVFDTFIHRTVTLPSHKLEKRKEMKYIKTALKKNSYPSQILYSRKITKAEITDSPRSNKGYVIIPYFPGLSEKIK